MVQVINNSIFACPECGKRFSKLPHLNSHLKQKHESSYKLTIVNDEAVPELRLKPKPLVKERFKSSLKRQKSIT